MVTGGEAADEIGLAVEVKEVEGGRAFVRPDGTLDDVVDAKERREQEHGGHAGDEGLPRDRPVEDGHRSGIMPQGVCLVDSRAD